MTLIADDETYEAIASSSQLIRRIREAYEGRHDALDALWWREHELSDGPSGERSPAALLRELSLPLFNARGSEDRAALIDAYEIAASEISGDKRAIESAIEALRAPAPGPLDVANEAPALDHSPKPPGPAQTRSVVHRLRLIIGISIIVVSAGIIVGLAVSSSRPSEPAVAGPTTTYTPVPGLINSPNPQVGPFPGFSQPQSTTFNAAQEIYSDVPGALVPSEYIAESTRFVLPLIDYVGIPGKTDKVLGYAYIARSIDQQVCILAYSTSRFVSSACTGEATFPSSGLQISVVTGKILNKITIFQNGNASGQSITLP